MADYGNLNKLRVEWKQGNFDYPQELKISGILYKLHSSSTNEFHEVIINGAKSFIVYHTSTAHKEEAKKANMQQWIVFIWSANARSIVLPYDVRPIAPQHFTYLTTRNFSAKGQHEINQYEAPVKESQERIGDVAIMKVFLPSGTAAIKGRVDTGAEISSLHADQFKVVGDNVQFINQELSKNTISVPIADQQAVKTADGGVEYRPVIELDIEINGKGIRGALFNLNNRDKMEYACLIGQNVLEKTNFLVDPNMNDTEVREQTETDGWIEDEEFTVNWEALNEEFKDERPEPLSEDDTSKLLQIMVEGNMTILELAQYIRTDALQALNELQP